VPILHGGVFRLLQVGSGQTVDTDAFADAYVQLIFRDGQNDALVGVHRIGHLDNVIRSGGPHSSYLARTCPHV